MRVGIHVSNFTRPGGPATLAGDLADAAAGVDNGFAALSVMYLICGRSGTWGRPGEDARGVLRHPERFSREVIPHLRSPQGGIDLTFGPC